MDSVTYLRQFESCDDIGNGDFSRIYEIADDYAALLAENERLKSEAGYTAADVATAAADGFRDGVRSIDLEQFRRAVDALFYWAEYNLFDNEKSEAVRLYGMIDAHKGE